MCLWFFIVAGKKNNRFLANTVDSCYLKSNLSPFRLSFECSSDKLDVFCSCFKQIEQINFLIVAVKWCLESCCLPKDALRWLYRSLKFAFQVFFQPNKFCLRFSRIKCFHWKLFGDDCSHSDSCKLCAFRGCFFLEIILDFIWSFSIVGISEFQRVGKFISMDSSEFIWNEFHPLNTQKFSLFQSAADSKHLLLF